jgi:hypothetical protein
MLGSGQILLNEQRTIPIDPPQLLAPLDNRTSRDPPATRGFTTTGSLG